MLAIFCAAGEMFDSGVDISSAGLAVTTGGTGTSTLLMVSLFSLGGDGPGDFTMVVVVEMSLDADAAAT